MIERKPQVMILGFGGTISMVPDSQGILKPAKKVEEIINLVPMIREMADVSFMELENRDSTNLTPKHWTKLSRVIGNINKQNSYDCTGIIVTHGTDTMAYTASAVALALGRGLQIPVVFTGAQLPLVAFGTDARFNLENATKTVLEAHEKGIAEVMITFSDKVLRGARSIKTSEAKFPAFDSPAYPYLGLITATGVSFEPHAQRRLEDVPLELKPKFASGVVTVDLSPGVDPKILQLILRSGLCKGIVLKSLGSGNVPSEGVYSLLPLIREATREHRIPVLVATKFVGGHTNMDIYEPGQQALRVGAIPAGDMTDVMAQVKLMWLLARQEWPWGLNENNLTSTREGIMTNYIGEIS